MASPRIQASRHLLFALALVDPRTSVIAGDGSAHRKLSPFCKGCLAEPFEADYFGGTFGGEPPRISGLSLSPADFKELALSGRVLIIENASAGTALAGWSCQRLAQEFPEAKMRREYDWLKNPEDRNLQKLGNAKWTGVAEAGVDAGERLSQDPEAPPFAPFYWGVREHRQGDVGSKEVVRKIKGIIAESVPQFMDKTENGVSMFDNAEFWLGAKGTGARAHMDSHCISTLSVVMSGARRWRIGPVPRMPAGAGRSPQEEVLFDDGVAYKLGWKPMFEFTVKEGDALLFPPGWIHETRNVAEGCTAALTTQFTNPRPVRYWRNYYQRLRRVGDLNPCWGEMFQWGSMGLKKKVAKLSESEAKSFAEEHFDKHVADKKLPHDVQHFYDLDGNGQVSREEFVDTFMEWVATERAVKREKVVRMPRPDMSLSAERVSTEL